MLKSYTFWIKSSVILMFFTGFVHSLSLFATSEPVNDKERQLLDLITNYKMDAGAGFHPTFSNLFTALSSCFSLLCLLGGMLLLYLVWKKLDLETMKGVLNINIFVFGICFVMMAFFTFLPPIVCSWLIFVNLITARLVIPSKS